MQGRLATELRSSRKALVLGIGGGGDIVGALSCALSCTRLGVDTMLGGVSWERFPIDPVPGPRSLAEITDGEEVAPGVILAGPTTRTNGGAVFAESHMARFLDEPTLLIDPSVGPSVVADGLIEAADRFGVDLLICVDVGGDVLGNGSEPGLASPLCDAVMLAAAALAQQRGLRSIAAVFGACCDGELTLTEVLDRIADVAAAGALIGVNSIDEPTAASLERAIELVPTEASAMAVECARGKVGPVTIRDGRRELLLTPVGAMTFYFDPATAVANAAPLAKAVLDAESLDQANTILAELGVRTELDYERDRAAAV